MAAIIAPILGEPCSLVVDFKQTSGDGLNVTLYRVARCRLDGEPASRAVWAEVHRWDLTFGRGFAGTLEDLCASLGAAVAAESWTQPRLLE